MSGPSPAGAPADQRPAGRYGSEPRPLVTRLAAAGLAVLLAAVLGWWLWVAAVRSTPDLRWELVGFRGVTDTSVDIRWLVHRPPDRTVECVVRSRSQSGAEVGRAHVTVPAGVGDSVEMVHTLETSDRPVTGEVLSCVEAAD